MTTSNKPAGAPAGASSPLNLPLINSMDVSGHEILNLSPAFLA